MSEPWEELAKESFEIVKESLKGFVERQDVDDFVKQKTALFAKEWWGSIHAATEDERKEHEANLKHLTAQVRGEARRLQIAIAEEAKDTIGRILETVAAFLLKAAPKLLALL
jgi:actin-like ATPase involved in cell morphogenesis